MAGLTRLELATFRVTGGRSNQLSYSPISMGFNFFMRSFKLLVRRSLPSLKARISVDGSYSPIFMGFNTILSYAILKKDGRARRSLPSRKTRTNGDWLLGQGSNLRPND